MEIPAIAIGIGLLFVAYFIFRSVVSTLKFSAKLLTWVIVFAVGAGAAYMYSQGMIGGDANGNVDYQSQTENPLYR